MKFGIVCAMPEEVTHFLEGACIEATIEPEFTPISVAGSDAVIASCGLGKVQAAMTATLLVERWHCTALISAGTAGGIQDVDPMQVVVGSGLLQHDYGRSRDGGTLELYRPGIPPLPQYSDVDCELKPDAAHLARLRDRAAHLDFVRFGRYASGDTFVNDLATRQRLTDLGVAAVDMECAAVAQVAEHFGLPWLVAKGISDDASHLSHDAFLEGLAEAARRSARAVTALLPALRE